MYNPFTTYYNPDGVPINIRSGLIESGYLDALEERLSRERHRSTNLNNGHNPEMDIAALSFFGPLIPVGLVIGTMDDDVSRLFGLTLSSVSAFGLYYFLKK